MIDSIEKLILAEGGGGWIVPVIVFLFYGVVNISKMIAERKQQQKLDEQPTEMSKANKPAGNVDYTTTRRAKNLPYAPKNDMPPVQKIPQRIQPRPEVRPIPVARPAQTPVRAQRPVPVHRETPAQRPAKQVQRSTNIKQVSVQPDRKRFSQSPSSAKEQVSQRKSVPKKRTVHQPKPAAQRVASAPAPAAQQNLLKLFQNSNEIKKGILYAEILGKPMALRDDQNLSLL
ncbi:MAG: hypothetical protein KAS23_00955 [Anaerohalosphaera sp.]|nr:hypothetical protein [Anaerohalosphaera sp.]